MDKAAAKSSYAPPGVSVRNGPVLNDRMDIDEPATNGYAKRKARNSTGKAIKYHDSSEDSDDAVPLVGYHLPLIRKTNHHPLRYSKIVLTNFLGQASKDLEAKQSPGFEFR